MEFSFNYLGFTQFNTAHLKNIIEENWRKVWKYRHENKIDSIVKPDHHDNEQHVREKTKKIELIQILLILVNQLAAYEILKVRFGTGLRLIKSIFIGFGKAQSSTNKIKLWTFIFNRRRSSKIWNIHWRIWRIQTVLSKYFWLSRLILSLIWRMIPCVYLSGADLLK